MAQNVIPFPAPAVTVPLASSCPDIREAREVIADIRATQVQCDMYSRAWKVCQIKLDWWHGYLAELMGVANDNVVELRRA